MTTPNRPLPRRPRRARPSLEGLETRRLLAGEPTFPLNAWAGLILNQPSPSTPPISIASYNQDAFVASHTLAVPALALDPGDLPAGSPPIRTPDGLTLRVPAPLDLRGEDGDVVRYAGGAEVDRLPKFYRAGVERSFPAYEKEQLALGAESSQLLQERMAATRGIQSGVTGLLRQRPNTLQAEQAESAAALARVHATPDDIDRDPKIREKSEAARSGDREAAAARAEATAFRRESARQVALYKRAGSSGDRIGAAEARVRGQAALYAAVLADVRMARAGSRAALSRIEAEGLRQEALDRPDLLGSYFGRVFEEGVTRPLELAKGLPSKLAAQSGSPAGRALARDAAAQAIDRIRLTSRLPEAEFAEVRSGLALSARLDADGLAKDGVARSLAGRAADTRGLLTAARSDLQGALEELAAARRPVGLLSSQGARVAAAGARVRAVQDLVEKLDLAAERLEASSAVALRDANRSFDLARKQLDESGEALGRRAGAVLKTAGKVFGAISAIEDGLTIGGDLREVYELRADRGRFIDAIDKLAEDVVRIGGKRAAEGLAAEAGGRASGRRSCSSRPRARPAGRPGRRSTRISWPSTSGPWPAGPGTPRPPADPWPGSDGPSTRPWSSSTPTRPPRRSTGRSPATCSSNDRGAGGPIPRRGRGSPPTLRFLPGFHQMHTEIR